MSSSSPSELLKEAAVFLSRQDQLARLRIEKPKKTYLCSFLLTREPQAAEIVLLTKIAKAMGLELDSDVQIVSQATKIEASSVLSFGPMISAEGLSRVAKAASLEGLMADPKLKKELWEKIKNWRF